MSDYLDRVEAQLAELTERGAHQHEPGRAPTGPRPPRRRPVGHPGGRPPRPPRRRASEAFAVLAGAAVVAAVVAIVLENAHPGTSHRTSAAAHTHTATSTATTPHSRPAPAKPKPTGVSVPVPASFHPQSFTAIGELTWWLLAPAPCPAAATKSPCGSILRTTNGGRSFDPVPSPNAALSGDQTAPGYSQLRFADPKNGFAFGPDMYATHDGGKTWQAVDLNGKVTEVAISNGQAYATVEPSGGGNGRLVRSPVSHAAWSTVAAAGVVSGGLWVQGSDIIVQSGVGTGIGGNVLVSSDGGTTFIAHPAPSPGLPCQFAAPEPPVVWAHCATGTESGVWRSTDGGAHFTVVVSHGLSLPNSAAFAAASASTAVVGYQQLYRSADDGSTWGAVSVPGVTQLAYLGFTDATHGAALGYVGSVAPQNERLYYTIDAGQSYHAVPVP